MDDKEIPSVDEYLTENTNELCINERKYIAVIIHSENDCTISQGGQ